MLNSAIFKRIGKMFFNLQTRLLLSRGGDKELLLHEFVGQRRLEGVKIILDNHPHWLESVWGSQERMTPLLSAALYGDMEMLRELLGRGAKRNATSTGPREGSLWRTPQDFAEFAVIDCAKNALVFAKMSGVSEVYLFLLKSASQEELALALEAAVQMRSLEWMRELLACQAPAHGTPFKAAIIFDFYEGVELLLRYGVDVNEPLPDDGGHVSDGYSGDLFSYLLLPLNMAVTYCKDIKIIETLLKHGALVDGPAPEAMVCSHNMKFPTNVENSPEHKEELLRLAQEERVTPLMLAFDKNYSDFTRVLVKYGANPKLICDRHFS